MQQSPPMFPPPKPATVKGKCTVGSNSTSKVYEVNLDDLECTCPRGAAWHMQKGGKWVPNILCNHKLKAIASLCSQNDSDETLRDFYEQQLGKKFNVWEAVSAFHKELRRNDVDKALYWATVLIPHRGPHGVVAYMRNILFEETRDMPLARHILKLSSYGRSVSIADMQNAVVRFCIAPKKWELPWRHGIFLDEMRGYQKLSEPYGYDVARAKDIIPAKETDKLRGYLLTGFAEGDRVLMQYGLKGWFKSKSEDHDHMKIDMLNELIDVMNGDQDNAFEYDEDYVHDFHRLLMRRLDVCGGVGYHELNALADALTGEPGNDPRATVPATKHKTTVNLGKQRRIKLGDFRRIPAYAHDNHTYAGKAKMRTFAAQLRPGADQTDLDFRMCGAYMGVAWRTLAYAQHATIDCKWGDVSWKPSWLWGHLDSMWY